MPDKLENLSLNCIRARDLEAFAARVADGHIRGLVPIIRARAASLARNPAASAEDIGLIVAFTPEQECVGYVGLMPGLMRLGEKDRKVFWGCTALIGEPFRGTGLIDRLHDKARESVATLCATGNTPAADKMYRRWRFKEVTATHSRHVHLGHLDVQVWPGKIWRKLRGLPARGAAGRSPAPRRSLCRLLAAAGLRRAEPVETDGTLSENAARLLRDRRGVFFYRSPETVNWMTALPWWSGPSPANETERRYYFNKEGKRLRYRVFDLRARRSGDFLGFAVFSVIEEDSEITLKLLDHAVRDDRDLGCLAALALRCAADAGADRLILPEACWRRSAVRMPFFKGSWRPPQPYFISSRDEELLRSIPDLAFSAADGDMGFW